MATVTLKNIPDELYERLKATAQAHRRSINSELIHCLETVLKPSKDLHGRASCSLASRPPTGRPKCFGS